MNYPEKIDELVMERMAWIKSSADHRERTIKTISRKMAAFDKNNPFAYDQVISALENNTRTPEDFYKQMK